MKGMQTRFNLPSLDNSSEKKKELENKIIDIYDDIKSRFINFGKFQEVLVRASRLKSSDLKHRQKPEEFTKRKVIEPLIELLGYEIIAAETSLNVPKGMRAPDYIIKPINENKPIFYVEAEPLNVDLYKEKIGVNQVNEWLLSRGSETDYGIATNGFEWILLKFDINSVKVKEMLKIDLRQLFVKNLHPEIFLSESKLDEILNYFINIHGSYISAFQEGYLEILEKHKEDISNRFYNDYVKYVFGYDKKGNVITGKNLSNAIITPFNKLDEDKRLFAVIFMNRIIFIKFLEEKGTIPSDLLIRLLREYKESGVPNSFYDAYLKPLFYEIFNKGKENRTPRIRENQLYTQIPYLNGGLFREIIEFEKSYNIENEGVELIINDLLSNYNFGFESDVNPDILGYIFEKTINFISGTGTEQQKMKGAYYTPDDVVEFIIEKTLMPVIYKKMIEGLKKAGWGDMDLKGYNSVDDILKPENMPKNPIHINKMIESIESIKVLDPACGSGHFLTATLSHMLRIQEHLHRVSGKSFNRYNLKKEIISKNIFGVDIDKNAVEIAMLRLWLSIIDEIKIQEQIDTLPNIDFNIIAGNSLIGWLNDEIVVHPIFNILDDCDINESLNSLSFFNESIVDEIKVLLNQSKLEPTLKAYRILVDIYSLEEGERAIEIREIVRKIRETIYSIITDAYTNFANEKSKSQKPELRRKISDKIDNRSPFHWNVDFYNVLEDGGFDVVIGNPPYIEDNINPDAEIINLSHVRKRYKERKTKIGPLFYQSKDCGNTHAYFIERSLKLLNQSGRLGFIVPISLISTKRMIPIINFIHNNTVENYYYNFDDRPGKIFRGLQHCRSTIIISEKGKGLNKIVTSKYHRWHSKNRQKLFEDIKSINLNLEKMDDLIPKIGSELEKDILYKLKKKSSENLGDFIAVKGVKIYYYNAVGYWIHTHDEESVPYAEYYDGLIEKDGLKIPNNFKERKLSSHYKILRFNLEDSHVVNGLLNSSLFYWWFVIWSDGRDLLAQQINNFPISLKDVPIDLKNKIKPLVDELIISYDENSNIKIDQRASGNVIKIKEIIPKKSKDIIDLIDDIFAEYYEFSDDEKEFIKKFDIEFRM